MLLFCRECCVPLRGRKEIVAHAKWHFDERDTTSTEQDLSTFDRMYDHCFPGARERSEKSRALLTFTKSLVSDRRRDESIECGVCKKRVTFCRHNMLTLRVLIRHACSHLTRQLHPFKCRHCAWSTHNDVFIRCHMKKAHGLNHEPVVEVDVDDFTPQYHDHIMEVVKRCYQKD